MIDEKKLALLLESRERRAETQRMLISSYRMPIVSFTVNMPGIEKKNGYSLIVFEAGVSAVREKLAPYIAAVKTVDEETGYEAFFAVDMNASKLKEKMCSIEESHPLGRLFDLDVIGADMKHYSREEFGYPKRKCLICDNEAVACTRTQKHSAEELRKRIEDIIAGWEKMK